MQIGQGTTSLDQTIGKDGETSMLEVLEDTNASTSQQNVDRMFRSERVRALLVRMNSREREILELRFGLRDGEIHTLNEAAKRFGITRERVRQIEAVALKRLRGLINPQDRSI